MKRLLLFLMLLAPLATFAYDAEINGIYYNFSGSEATVTYYSRDYSSNRSAYTGAVSIPSTLTYNGKTYSVTSIGIYAFLQCSNLTSITIPNSVTSIGNFAFEWCTGLTSITIPNSVTSIGDSAFERCTGLTSITIPNSVTSIGESTFFLCTGLTSITIPNGVTSIKHSAFDTCSSLTSITIPNSVTSIGERAFRGCSSLTSITIPNSVTSIGTQAFYECSNVKDLIYAEGCTIALPTSLTSIESVTIPNSVMIIGDYAFRDCSGLTSITIPNSVTSIGKSAFNYCEGLTSITIPNSVTSIGNWAFRDCSGLTSITIPNSVTSIGEMVFASCSAITEAKIGDGIFFIASSLFSNCKKLAKVTLGANIEYIESKAFYNCPLTDIYSYAADAPKCSSDAFTMVKADCNLWVKPGSVELYKASNVWNEFNIQEMTGSLNYDVIMSSTGYATFYSSESAYTLPAGLAAQVVTKCSNNELTYKTIANGSSSGVIPKGTAVVLVAASKEAGVYTLEPSKSTSSYTGTNLLHGSDEATTTTASGTNYYYKLTYGEGAENDIFGWYWGAEDGAAFQIDGHKAWLALPKSSVTRSGFALDDETSIEEVMTEEDEVYYDLQGRRIGTPTASGLYIVNGKKVIIKK